MVSEIAVNQANLNLSTDLTWDIAIDQSTSCTGITVMATDETIAGTFDIHRDKSLPDRVFYKELKEFLVRLTSNKKVRMLVYEKPLPKRQFQNAQRVLYELKGRLEEWIYDIPELEAADIIDSIFPQTWKSLVMDKSKGKNRSGKKIEIARDLIDRYPALREYGMAYPYTDYDGFDSLGILTGYKRYAFNSVGMEQIHGTIEQRHIAAVFYYAADKNKSFREVKDEAFGLYKEFPCLWDMKFMAYNLGYKLTQNIRMASSGDVPVMTMLPPTEHQYLKWSYNMDVEGKNVFAFIFKKSYLSRNNYEAFCDILPCNQEVYGE